MATHHSSIGVPRLANPATATGTADITDEQTGERLTVPAWEGFPDSEGRPQARMVAQRDGTVIPRTPADLALCDALGLRRVPGTEG